MLMSVRVCVWPLSCVLVLKLARPTRPVVGVGPLAPGLAASASSCAIGAGHRQGKLLNSSPGLAPLHLTEVRSRED